MYKKRILHVVGIWLLASLVSAIAYYMAWKAWPGANLFVSEYLTALLTLPTAFLHTLSFYDNLVMRVAGIAYVIYTVIYWAVLVRLQTLYVTRGRLRYLVIFAVILLVSAIRWMYYADGLMGI